MELKFKQIGSCLTDIGIRGKTIGEHFVELRTAKGWSLKELVAASGVPATYYRSAEVTNKIPSLIIVKRLPIAYGIILLVF